MRAAEAEAGPSRQAAREGRQPGGHEPAWHLEEVGMVQGGQSVGFRRGRAGREGQG